MYNESTRVTLNHVISDIAFDRLEGANVLSDIIYVSSWALERSVGLTP